MRWAWGFRVMRRVLIGAERGEVEVDERLLLAPLVGVLAADRNDLPDDFYVEAVRLGLAVDFLDVLGKRLLLFVEPFDAFDEGAQMPGVDLFRPGLIRFPGLGH